LPAQILAETLFPKNRLQLSQLLCVFCSETLADYTDDRLVSCHRLFVAAAGLTAGGTVCYFDGGLCRPIPLVLYLLNQAKCFPS
jgi:hypothetical protein